MSSYFLLFPLLIPTDPSYGAGATLGNTLYYHSMREQAFGQNPHDGNVFAGAADSGWKPGASDTSVKDCNSIMQSGNDCWLTKTSKKLRVLTNLEQGTSSWAAGVDFPAPRATESFFGACDGKLWSIGGHQSHAHELWSWAPGDTSWDRSHASSGMSTFLSHSMKDELVCVDETKTLWIIGTRYFNDVGKYHIPTDTWTWGVSSFVPWPDQLVHGIHERTVAYWPQEAKVYFMGAYYYDKRANSNYYYRTGEDGMINYRSVRVFNLRTETWGDNLALALLPVSFPHDESNGAAVIGSFLIIEAASTAVPPGSTNRILMRYDLNQGSDGLWETIPNIDINKSGYKSVVSFGFSAYYMGGQTGLGVIRNSAYGGTTYHYEFKNQVRRFGTCPRGCFIERAKAPIGRQMDTCEPCSAGKYSSFPDLYSAASSCVSCIPGSVTVRPGETQCNSCSSGWSSPPGGTCCSPAVTVLPRTVSFPSVQLGSKSTVDLFVIHSGPHSVSWHIDTTTLPSWLNISQVTGTLAGGQTLTLQLTASHTNTSAALGTEDFPLAIVVGKKEQATTTFIDASSKKQLYACHEKDVVHGILQTQLVSTTFERITGNVHASSSTISFVSGDLVKSNFEWTLLTNDQGGRRIFTGGADVTANVGTLTVDVGNIFDNKDGSYTIRHVPQAEGTSFTLSVFVNELSATTTSFEVTRATCSESSGALTVADGSSCECGPGSSRQNVDDTGACAKCSTGFYQSSSGKFTCTPCPAGLYGPTVGAVGLNNCVTCTLGRTGVVSGLASVDACSECPKGTFGSAPGVCSPCKSTNYTTSTGALSCVTSNIGEKFVSSSFAPLLCDAGTFGSAPGNCTACRDMEYSVSKGSTLCVKAEIGEKFVSSSFAPLLCDAGTFGSVAGVCTACGDMEYSISKRSTSCVKVKIGEEFVSSSSVPQDCNTGFFGSTPGVCSKCTVGQYQDRKGESECQECPVDTYLSKTGKSSKADCEKCSSDTSTGASTSNENSSSCLCKKTLFYINTSDGTCSQCPTGADCSHKDGIHLNEIVAINGFWRPHPTSEIFSAFFLSFFFFLLFFTLETYFFHSASSITTHY